MKPGDRWLFRFMGRFVPVKIVSILAYGVECEFLEDCSPVKTGEKLICDIGCLYKEGEGK